MAKPHCEKHKRYVPYCDDCKAIVKAAEEVQGQIETGKEQPADTGEGAEGAPGPDAEATSEALKAEVGFPGATIDETEKAMSEAGEFDPGVVEHVSLQDAIDAGAERMEIDGDGNVVRVPDLDTAPATSPVLDVPAERIPGDLGAEPDQEPEAELYDKAFADGEKAGRKEVIAWVKEWFADGTDTGAFQLLTHLHKKASQ